MNLIIKMEIKKKILIILSILSLLVLSGCNLHFRWWIEEHCNRLGMEWYGQEFYNTVRCTNGTYIFKFDYKQFEQMDKISCCNYIPIPISITPIINITPIIKYDSCCNCGCNNCNCGCNKND